MKKTAWNALFNTSYTDLGKLLAAGDLDIKTIRRIYNERRRTAKRRLAGVSRSEVQAEFGNIPKEYFQKSANLTTTSALLHALVDVNRYLQSKESTISGLKYQREKYINTAQVRGLPVDESNYVRWIEFIRWFKTSMYAALYDSDSEEVEEAFTEGINPSEWTAAFERIRILEHNRSQENINERYNNQNRERR